MKITSTFLISALAAGCMGNLAELAVSPAPANQQYHVSVHGNDADSGSAESPLKTISAAAQLARPGDTITVHEGTYREWVRPPRGGTGEDTRITYRAAEGEKVVIKGSEIIKGWKKVRGSTWKAELPNTFFGDYNPYALKLTGGWLEYGKWHHRGDVYLNGKAFLEKRTEKEVGDASGTWFCRTDKKTTFITANFGESDPNRETVEIAVRQSLFMPEISGLKYVTLDGFHFRHAASNWSPPNIVLQPGAVGTRMGKRWIIQNCIVTDCRTVGIILGTAPGVDYEDIDAYGDHVIKNNVIRRCGQAGIAGLRGATRSRIENNLIEEINYRKEFGGAETAGIKFHYSVDTIISRNLIRGVYRQGQSSAFGIWMDNANQGTRITGNIIYNTDTDPIFLEINHGPILLDNNVVVGGRRKRIRSNSEANVFAHNLFVDCAYWWATGKKARYPRYYKPHTGRVAGKKIATAAQDRWYNNVFIRTGLDRVEKTRGYKVEKVKDYRSDYNLFLEGAKKSLFGDKNSVVDAHVTDFSIEERPEGVTITFSAGEQQRRLKGPWVNAKLVGVFETAGQTIEDRHGNPITVDTDIHGRKRTRPVPGPLSKLKSGRNSISWDRVKEE